MSSIAGRTFLQCGHAHRVSPADAIAPPVPISGSAELLQILGLYTPAGRLVRGLLLAHIGLALTAIAMFGMIGLLTGIWIAEHPRIAPPVMGVCNVLYLPAILLGILILQRIATRLPLLP